MWMKFPHKAPSSFKDTVSMLEQYQLRIVLQDKVKKLQKKSVKMHLNKENPISDLLTSQEELDADKSIPTNAKPRHNINQNNEKPPSDLFTCQQELAASKSISTFGKLTCNINVINVKME
eukprot:8372272-Ditylum_brightwellii.AAC.1